MGEQARLRAADGHEFGAYVAGPQGTPKGAVVVVQEIYGVNHHFRSVSDRLAAAGYLAIAPALFDRVEPGFEGTYDDAGREHGLAILQKLKPEWMQADVLAAVRYARDEYKTKVAVVGFCLGGSLAWVAAEQMPVSAAVGYYGGWIAKQNDRQPKAPIMLHFGEQDAHIPMSDVEAIRAAHPDVPVYTYEAGHGFNCDERGSYAPDAARIAWGRTMEFLEQHLGGRLDNSAVQ